MSAVTVRSYRNRLEGLGQVLASDRPDGVFVGAQPSPTSGDWLPSLFSAIGQVGAAGAQAAGTVMAAKQYAKAARGGIAPPMAYGAPLPVSSGPSMGTLLAIGVLGVGAYVLLKG